MVDISAAPVPSVRFKLEMFWAPQCTPLHPRFYSHSFLFLRHSASEVPTLLLNWASCPTLYANEAPTTTSCLSATLSLFPSFSLTLSLFSCPTHTLVMSFVFFFCDNSNSLNFCHFIFNYPIKQTRVTHLLYGESSCFTVFRDDIKLFCSPACIVMSLLHKPKTSSLMNVI